MDDISFEYEGTLVGLGCVARREESSRYGWVIDVVDGWVQPHHGTARSARVPLPADAVYRLSWLLADEVWDAWEAHHEHPYYLNAR